MKSGVRLPVMTALFTITALGASNGDFLSHYKGTPYQDGYYNGGAQKIPGVVHCAYYDRGGEGVAYHDTDAKNHGSGELNPANGCLLYTS